MKDAQRAERTARIGALSSIVTGALVLTPVCQRWPNGVQPCIVTVIFALTFFAFVFHQEVRVLAAKPFRK